MWNQELSRTSACRQWSQRSEEKFRNRLWAYIECSIPDSDPDKLAAVHRHGGEVDRLIKEVNTALHGTPDKKRLTKAFADLAALTVVLLGLDPVAARKPYFGFHDAIMRFARRVAGGAH